MWFVDWAGAPIPSAMDRKQPHRSSSGMFPHPLEPYPDLIVNLCPTGMIPTAEMTPHVPLTPQQVVEDTCHAIELGASIVHLHARDSDGRPTYRAEPYEEMILGIRRHHPDMVICVSCSGRDFPEFERRSEVLELTGSARPDMASLTMTSLDFPTGPSINAPDMVLALAEKMVDRGIKPELECFDFGMVNAAKILIARGIIGSPPYFNILLGSRYSAPATARHLSTMVDDLPRGAIWSATGIGMFQLPVHALALAMGGHCRVGLEDNIYRDSATKELATNAELVERVVKLAEMLGRKPSTPAATRELLGIEPLNE